MDKIDQVLWEQELREHLDHDADGRDESTGSTESAAFTTLLELNRNADSGERTEFRAHPEFRETPQSRDPAESWELAESWEPDVLTEPAEFKDLETLVGLEELDHLDDTPRAEPPFASYGRYFVLSVVLIALAMLAVGSVGWSIGYFAV